jgi:hypothetical protein
MDLRLCDLELKIEGELEKLVGQVYQELGERGVHMRPHVWISDDWFCPDGVPGFAVPFYLAHPRLARLEQNQMLEVEGGTPDWCLRILRHELGHAVENAYLIRRLRPRQKLFGKSSEKYPKYYIPRPYSRSFVQHLDFWYAQSHPDEDFAETFAVWLTPGSDWAARYRGWRALHKLQYVDELMRSLVDRPAAVTTTRTVDPLRSIRKTLREHYEERRRHYGVGTGDQYDRELRKLFSDQPEHARNLKAARFLKRLRKDARRLVRRFTGEYLYTIDQVLGIMIDRCEKLNLRLATDEAQARQEFLVFLTAQTMNYLHSGRHRVAV